MLPPAEDNYGDDACDIMVLHSTPPFLVIATSSGILHHCIAMSKDDDPLQPILHVYESIELSLSLLSDSATLSVATTLHKDISSLSRYFVTHPNGVHAIWVPFIEQLNQAADQEYTEEESVVEHLISTRVTTEEAAVMPTVPYGLLVAVYPTIYVRLILLLPNGEIIAQRLTPILLPASPKKRQSGDDPLDTKLEVLKKVEARKVDFTAHVKQILSRSSNCTVPLMKSSGKTDSNLPGEEGVQLLLTTIDLLRREYLAKLDLAANTMERRAKVLRKDKENQASTIAKLQREKDDLIVSVEKLGAKYDDAFEKQMMLTERVENILSRMQRNDKQLSDAEKELADKLQRVNKTVNLMRDNLENVKVKLQYQERQIGKVSGVVIKEKSSSSNLKGSPQQNSPTIRSPSELNGIKKMLSSQNETISQLLERVTILKTNFE